MILCDNGGKISQTHRKMSLKTSFFGQKSISSWGYFAWKKEEFLEKKSVFAVPSRPPDYLTGLADSVDHTGSLQESISKNQSPLEKLADETGILRRLSNIRLSNPADDLLRDKSTRILFFAGLHQKHGGMEAFRNIDPSTLTSRVESEWNDFKVALENAKSGLQGHNAGANDFSFFQAILAQYGLNDDDQKIALVNFRTWEIREAKDEANAFTEFFGVDPRDLFVTFEQKKEGNPTLDITAILPERGVVEATDAQAFLEELKDEGNKEILTAWQHDFDSNDAMTQASAHTRFAFLLDYFQRKEGGKRQNTLAGSHLREQIDGMSVGPFERYVGGTVDVLMDSSSSVGERGSAALILGSVLFGFFGKGPLGKFKRLLQVVLGAGAIETITKKLDGGRGILERFGVTGKLFGENGADQYRHDFLRSMDLLDAQDSGRHRTLLSEIEKKGVTADEMLNFNDFYQKRIRESKKPADIYRDSDFPRNIKSAIQAMQYGGPSMTDTEALTIYLELQGSLFGYVAAGHGHDKRAGILGEKILRKQHAGKTITEVLDYYMGVSEIRETANQSVAADILSGVGWATDSVTEFLSGIAKEHMDDFVVWLESMKGANLLTILGKLLRAGWDVVYEAGKLILKYSGITMLWEKGKGFVVDSWGKLGPWSEAIALSTSVSAMEKEVPRGMGALTATTTINTLKGLNPEIMRRIADVYGFVEEDALEDFIAENFADIKLLIGTAQHSRTLSPQKLLAMDVVHAFLNPTLRAQSGDVASDIVVGGMRITSNWSQEVSHAIFRRAGSLGNFGSSGVATTDLFVSTLAETLTPDNINLIGALEAKANMETLVTKKAVLYETPTQDETSHWTRENFEKTLEIAMNMSNFDIKSYDGKTTGTNPVPKTNLKELEKYLDKMITLTGNPNRRNKMARGAIILPSDTNVPPKKISMPSKWQQNLADVRQSADDGQGHVYNSNGLLPYFPLLAASQQFVHNAVYPKFINMHKNYSGLTQAELFQKAKEEMFAAYQRDGVLQEFLQEMQGMERANLSGGNFSGPSRDFVIKQMQLDMVASLMYYGLIAIPKDWKKIP